MSGNVKIIGELDSLIAKYQIPDRPIDSKAPLKDPHDAVLWLRQKKKTGGKWQVYDKTAAGIGTATGIGLGTVSAGLGIGAAATSAVVPVAIGLGVAAGVAGGAGGIIAPLSNMKWIRKACKGLWKTVKRTKGKHRREAANILLHGSGVYAKIRVAGKRHPPLPHPKDPHGQLSADVMMLFASDLRVRTLAMEYQQGGMHRHHAVETVKAWFKSDY